MVSPIERDHAAHAQDRPAPDDTPADRSRRRAQWMTLAQHGDAHGLPGAARRPRTRARPLPPPARQGQPGLSPTRYQDTFLALHRARVTPTQPPRPIEPWLFAIARNVAADYGRRWERRTRHEVLTDSAPEPVPEPAPRDWGPICATAMRALPNRQREALQLLEVQGCRSARPRPGSGRTPGALKLPGAPRVSRLEDRLSKVSHPSW